MTPMIDVVFLLIIFFLVSSHLARREIRVPLELPAVSTAAADASQPAITISILSDGTWWIGGREASPRSLVEALQQPHKAQDDDVMVRIRADAAVPYERVVPVLSAAAQQGYSDVAIAVIHASEK